jgi:hypothetical protein
VKKVREADYRSQVLVAEIVCSVPFRYRASGEGSVVGVQGSAKEQMP